MSRPDFSDLYAQFEIVEYQCKNNNNHTFTYVTPGIEILTGYPANDFINDNVRSFRSLIHKEDQKYVEEQTDTALNRQQPLSLTFRIITAQDTVKWLQCKNLPIIENGKTTGFKGILSDITNVKKQEANLLASEKKFRNLFKNHAAIKLLIDPNDGQIVEANEAAEKFYGWSAAELKQKKISDINTLPPKQIEKEIEKVRSRQNVHFNFQHRKADGTIADVEVFSSKVTFEGKDLLHSIIHDVTGSKDTEKMLNLMSKTVEQSPVSIIITNKSGSIEYINNTFCQTSGYTSDEVIGKNIDNFRSGHHPEDFYKILWKTVESGEKWQGEIKNKRKNGTFYWEHEIIFPISEPDGTITHYVGIKEDITEKKQMVNELVKAKEKAQESDKLKSIFLTNLSHEIRTPLNGIMGFVNLLQKPGLGEDVRQKYLDIVQTSSEHLLKTLHDILEISQLETEQITVYKTEFELNAAIDFVYQQMKNKIWEKQLEFKIDNKLEQDNCILYTDRSMLETILRHLTDNAIKFTEKGFIKLSVEHTNENISIKIHDTGKGIPKDRINAIFDRFVQADVSSTRLHEGAGVGLSIAKGYADLLGAPINVESTPGQGSTFTITLPQETIISKAKVPDTQEKDKQPIVKNKLALIVEDDEISFMYLNIILQETGFKTLRAKDGDTAVQLCKEHDDIALIMMDINLSGTDGLSATRQIRSFNKNVLIIAQTAYTDEFNEKAAIEAGCNLFLHKPVEKEKLLRNITNILDT